jgi:hypothetical protein
MIGHQSLELLGTELAALDALLFVKLRGGSD